MSVVWLGGRVGALIHQGGWWMEVTQVLLLITSHTQVHIQSVEVKFLRTIIFSKKVKQVWEKIQSYSLMVLDFVGDLKSWFGKNHY